MNDLLHHADYPAPEEMQADTITPCSLDDDGTPTFSEFLRQRYGDKWCVAQRLTDRLRGKGYTTVIPSTKYGALKEEWVAGHPAVTAVATLTGPHADFIRRAVAETLRYWSPEGVG